MENNNLLFLLLFLIVTLPACSENESYPSGDFIPIRSGKTILAAELDLPQGNGPHPAIIMVHGSGKLDRHVFSGAAQNYLRLGYAVLRYDKRGVGQSTGRYLNVNAQNSQRVFAILADDVKAIANYLADHKDIDANRIVLLGPSQAGWIMPLAANNSPHISGMVSISGAVSPVGISDYYDRIAENDLTDEEIDEALANYSGVLGFNPRKSLEQMDIPALWVYGGKDKSNPTRNDVKILEHIMSNFNKNFTIHVFPNLNHHLIDVTTHATIPDTQICVNDWLIKNI